MKFRNKKKRLLIAIPIILLLCNLVPVKNIFGFLFDENHYQYSNENGSFTFSELKLRDVKMMQRRWDLFRKQSNDTTLYRTFSKNPLAFWRWGEYFYDKRYRYPYKNWKIIERNRGEIYLKSKWQDF